MLSEVIRFTLPTTLTISAPAFLRLRQTVSAAGATSQYFGYSTPTKLLPMPKKRHEITWVIQWLDSSEPISESASLTAEVSGLSQGSDATSMVFHFDDAQAPDFEKALQSRVCEFAMLRFTDESPFSNAAFQASVHKAYTDCYRMLGFSGGYWAYAVNTTEGTGAPVVAAAGGRLAGKDHRLALYFLGWESIELHQDEVGGAVFNEEMDKLAPYFGAGSGAWYAHLQKH